MSRFSKNSTAIFGWDYADPNGGLFKKGKLYIVEEDKGEIVEIIGQDKNYLVPSNYLQTADEYRKANP